MASRGNPDDSIVEVYSAKDAVEAQGIRGALQQVGIEARIVGDSLGNAAGWLPLGQVIAPRIWVRESDQSRARQVIADWISGVPGDVAVPDETDRLESQAEEPAPADREAPARGARMNLLGKGIVVLVVGSIVLGAVAAARNHLYLTQWERAEARRCGMEFVRFEDGAPRAARDLPARIEGGVRIVYRLQYVYMAEGSPYYLSFETRTGWAGQPDSLAVHYNPRDPRERVVGPLMSPSWCLVIGTVVGALLLFSANRLR